MSWIVGAVPGWLPLAIVTALYLWQAAEYWFRGGHAMALVFLGYALANLGLIWDFGRFDG